MKGLVVFVLVLFCLGLVPETEATLLDRQVERQRYLGRRPYCVPKGGYCLTRNDCCLKPSKRFKYKCAHWQVKYVGVIHHIFYMNINSEVQ
ncbi:Hypothetical predicted protein [Paramuricea clavata]|uniref:Uncharacterized protein n=1 Tax=Paramuricea clavata TaxID=317549 RepID=A0A6S7H7L8_PARCT|nr:Hypothetical predicted protein [Paramuricea clavata]